MMASFLISAALAAALAATQPPVVILDPGHGGEDWGATVTGRREKDIALAVAKRLKDRLEKDGLARVKLTRESDSYVPLDERMQKGAIFISLHANKVKQKSVRGVVVYAWGKERIKHARGHKKAKLDLPPLPPPPGEQSKASRELSASFVRALRSEGFRAESDRADLYVLKNPSAPAILVEMGYLSNPNEAAMLEDSKYQERLADVMARSLSSYLSGRPSTSAGR
jgi:N-acetylmuramoyl-L-alanine amidase